MFLHGGVLNDFTGVLDGTPKNHPFSWNLSLFPTSLGTPMTSWKSSHVQPPCFMWGFPARHFWVLQNRSDLLKKRRLPSFDRWMITGGPDILGHPPCVKSHHFTHQRPVDPGSRGDPVLFLHRHSECVAQSLARHDGGASIGGFHHSKIFSGKLA